MVKDCAVVYHIKNKCTRKELKTRSVQTNIHECGQSLINHFERMKGVFFNTIMTECLSYV